MSAVNIALVAFRLAIGVWLLWSVPRLVRPARTVDVTSVSVVIPARNEADALPMLLGSLPEGI